MASAPWYSISGAVYCKSNLLEPVYHSQKQVMLTLWHGKNQPSSLTYVNGSLHSFSPILLFHRWISSTTLLCTCRSASLYFLSGVMLGAEGYSKTWGSQKYQSVFLDLYRLFFFFFLTSRTIYSLYSLGHNRILETWWNAVCKNSHFKADIYNSKWNNNKDPICYTFPLKTCQLYNICLFPRTEFLWSSVLCDQICPYKKVCCFSVS